MKPGPCGPGFFCARPCWNGGVAHVTQGLPWGRRLALALAAGLISGAVCHAVLLYSCTEGDFYAALRMARDVLAWAVIRSKAPAPAMRD